MQAIIMAGGEGTRLKSVTGTLPKPMAPLCGKPVLEHILHLLKRNGITEARITLRYRPEVISDYFGDGRRFGMKLSYHVETEPLGTAGGVRACREFYENRDFLVISGDSVCDFDLKALMEAHRRHRPAVTMALYAHPQPLQYGIVLTDRQDRVIRFVEKPAWEQVVSDLVNTGIYVISPEAMTFVPENKAFDFAKDLFPKLLENGYGICGAAMEGYWCDIGSPRAYYQCNLDALDGRIRLDAIPAPDLPKNNYVNRPDAGKQELILCHSRAQLMRRLSGFLMEVGADFSDGIRVDSAGGRVRICPAADSEGLLLSACTPNPADAPALAEEYRKLIRRLDSEA